MTQSPNPDLEPAGPAASAPPPWRKRHPLAARLLLYGLGAAIVAGVAVLLVRRMGEDRQDRAAFLEAQLDGLGLVFIRPGGAKQVLGVLDREYGDPDLPVPLRQRALRVRAMARAHLDDLPGALEVLDEAAALSVPPRDRAGLVIERAELLARSKRVPEALAALDALAGVQDPVVRLVAGQVRAFALALDDRAADGRAAVEAVLASLEGPLPGAEAALWLGMRTISPAEAATDATRLALEGEHERDPALAWERLAALAPADLEALTAAALGLQALGLESRAVEVWARAVSADPAGAAAKAQYVPEATALERIREQGLKRGADGGR